jgi:hypothetical protein
MKFRIIKDKIGFSSQYFLPRQGWNSIFDDNLMDIKSPTYDKNSLRELKLKRIK